MHVVDRAIVGGEGLAAAAGHPEIAEAWGIRVLVVRGRSCLMVASRGPGW